MGIGLADPDPLEVCRFDGGARVGHADQGMRYAYISASTKVCSLRNDPFSWGMQNADMSEPKNHLKAWRLFRHLTQEELADQVDTTKAVISNLETGSRGLSDKWLRRLAPVLNTSPGYLLDHDPNDLPTDVLDIWAEIPVEQREQALKVLQSFKRTGTDG
jgi:transcriptional regulator with XRE-family HTH domain